MVGVEAFGLRHSLLLGGGGGGRVWVPLPLPLLSVLHLFGHQPGILRGEGKKSGW
jgi:hypothetical protein